MAKAGGRSAINWCLLARDIIETYPGWDFEKIGELTLDQVLILTVKRAELQRVGRITIEAAEAKARGVVSGKTGKQVAQEMKADLAKRARAARRTARREADRAAAQRVAERNQESNP